MSEKKQSLFNRTFKTIVNKRQRLLDGKINCIPWGLPRFEEENPGIEQGKSYLLTGSTKSAKTQICDFLFLYNTIQQVVDNKLNIKLKIFYFTLEISKEEKMLLCFSNILYVKEGIRVSPTDLKSTKSSNVLSQKTLDIIKKYEVYFEKIEEIVEFIDSTRHATGVYNLVRDYALANGKIHTRTISIKDKLTSVDKLIEVEDYYEPNNPEEYVIVILDHAGILSTERNNGIQLSQHESMSLLSEYFLKLRNRFNYIPVLVQQQAMAGQSLEHRKMNALKPSIANLGDNKTIAREFNTVIGIFSPFQNELPDYYGYDIKQLKDNCRFIEIIISRDGGAGTICPLYFDGAVNYFKELPLPNNKEAINEVYNFIKNIKK